MRLQRRGPDLLGLVSLFKGILEISLKLLSCEDTDEAAFSKPRKEPRN
jgi:hypothetical protein